MHLSAILVLIIFKHPIYTIRKNCVDMYAGHGRWSIEICLSEKGALAKNRLENVVIACYKRCTGAGVLE